MKARTCALLLLMMLSPLVHASNCDNGAGTHAMPAALVADYDSVHRRLGLVARQQPLNHVLAAITDATGIEFINDGGDGCEAVDVEFEHVALENALAQLLRGRSYVVRTSVLGKLSIWLLPPGDGERLTDTDVAHEAFYQGLQGNPGIEELAEQIRQLEAESP